MKIWDLIGGGEMVYSMEKRLRNVSVGKQAVTLICVGKIGKESGEEAQECECGIGWLHEGF